MLPHLVTPPSDDPTDLYRLRDGIMAADLLAAAIVWIDVFSELAREPSTLDEICARLGIHPRPTDVLFTLSKALGLVAEQDGIFTVTAKGRAFAVEGSPFSIGPYYASMKDRPQTIDMVNVLRTGKPANWGTTDPAAWAQSMERPEFAERFTAAMDCRGLVLGQALAERVDLSGRRVLLDIAGGSGIYACTLAARHPHLRAAVFERPPVDRIARAAVARQQMAGRVDVVTGDFFADDLPRGYDVHLISNVLHDWDADVVLRILTRSHATLDAGGLLIVHDAHLDDAKDGPVPVALYSVLLMTITEGRCYSTAEMRAFLDRAGFDWLDFGPTAIDRSFILARKR